MNDGEYIRIMRPLRTGGGGREGVVVVSMVLLGWMMAREGNDSGNDGPGRQADNGGRTGQVVVQESERTKDLV